MKASKSVWYRSGSQAQGKARETAKNSKDVTSGYHLQPERALTGYVLRLRRDLLPAATLFIL